MCHQRACQSESVYDPLLRSMGCYWQANSTYVYFAETTYRQERIQTSSWRRFGLVLIHALGGGLRPDPRVLMFAIDVVVENSQHFRYSTRMWVWEAGGGELLCKRSASEMILDSHLITMVFTFLCSCHFASHDTVKISVSSLVVIHLKRWSCTPCNVFRR